jgi:hypothetical protein
MVLWGLALNGIVRVGIVWYCEGWHCMILWGLALYGIVRVGIVCGYCEGWHCMILWGLALYGIVRVGILLTCRKHFHASFISLRGNGGGRGVAHNKTNLISPLWDAYTKPVMWVVMYLCYEYRFYLFLRFSYCILELFWRSPPFWLNIVYYQTTCLCGRCLFNSACFRHTKYYKPSII